MFTSYITKVKPNITPVGVHPQLRLQWTVVDWWQVVHAFTLALVCHLAIFIMSPTQEWCLNTMRDEGGGAMGRKSSLPIIIVRVFFSPLLSLWFILFDNTVVGPPSFNQSFAQSQWSSNNGDDERPEEVREPLCLSWHLEDSFGPRRASRAVLSMWSCRVKLDEEQLKYAGLAQENAQHYWTVYGGW
jgi:hypothetical protein